MPTPKAILTQPWMQSPGFNAAAIIAMIAVLALVGVDINALVPETVRAWRCETTTTTTVETVAPPVVEAVPVVAPQVEPVEPVEAIEVEQVVE